MRWSSVFPLPVPSVMMRSTVPLPSISPMGRASRLPGELEASIRIAGMVGVSRASCQLSHTKTEGPWSVDTVDKNSGVVSPDISTTSAARVTVGGALSLQRKKFTESIHIRGGGAATNGMIPWPMVKLPSTQVPPVYRTSSRPSPSMSGTSSTRNDASGIVNVVHVASVRSAPLRNPVLVTM